MRGLLEPADAESVVRGRKSATGPERIAKVGHNPHPTPWMPVLS
jgi:hypothetical protein